LAISSWLLAPASFGFCEPDELDTSKYLPKSASF
jgi:hypothetical protein